MDFAFILQQRDQRTETFYRIIIDPRPKAFIETFQMSVMMPARRQTRFTAVFTGLSKAYPVSRLMSFASLAAIIWIFNDGQTPK
jgi:hypothetical protein